MARYNYNQECNLRLYNFFRSNFINEPIYNSNEPDFITTILSANLITNLMCDNSDTTTTTSISPCVIPSATFEIIACTVNAIDANTKDIQYAFTSSGTGSITNETFQYDLIVNGSIVGTSALSSSGAFKVPGEDTNDQTVRVTYTFTNCNAVYTFVYEFNVPAGLPATCPSLGIFTMTMQNQVADASATYYREANDLIIVLEGFDNNSIVKVDIELIYNYLSSPNQTLVIPYCVYVDCDDVQRCKVSDYVWKSKDYEALAMYEALTQLPACQDLDCTNACSILEVLNNKIANYDCSC
jgi:hypothetical protein